MPDSSPEDPFASPPPAAGTTGSVPTSRRAARAAAEQQPAAPASSAHPALATPAPSSRTIEADSGPATQPLDLSDEDHPWIFGNAAAAPAVPYSRTGSAAAREAAPPSTEHPASTTTLESLFEEQATADDSGDVPPAKKRRKRRIGGWIALGVVLLIFGGIAAGGLWVWNTYEPQIREVMGWEEPKDYEDGLAHGEVFVTINSGDTGAPISEALYDAGVTKTPEAFYDYLVDTGQNPPFVPGVFKLQEQMTSAAALEGLLDPANKMENTAQLQEGLTVAKSLPILAEGTGIPLEEFQAATADPSAYGVGADSLEGWLFPATYTFSPGVTAQEVIQTLVDRTIQSLDEAGVPVEDRQEILTIASIIQREAAYEVDMQKVSRVIQNRLSPDNQETFGKLEMDSTAQFGVGEDDGTASTSEEAQFDPNPWNTYVHPGLPIGPIANPGDVAIKAAVQPAEGPWMYFVTVNFETGETVFTNTYADHLRAVDQMRAWCTDHPDAGC